MKNIKINPEQKKAITYDSGPLLVVAGAGTGKTTVITERIRYLLTEKNVSPKEILALTFTEKAATEMLNRVDEAMPLGYEEPWLSTFHSFCDRILQQEALEIGLDPSFRILSEPEQWLLVRQHLFEFDLKYYRPLGNPTKFISAMLQLFSRAKDEVVNHEEFFAYTTACKTTEDEAEKEEKEKLMELATAYKKYQELLISENAMDFGDLLLWTIKLFTGRPSILKKYQQQFKYILVDEFQDTNFAQFEIIKLLAPAAKNPNLLVVGDDDQSIYKFRGAAISNILDFQKNYPGAETVVLVKNYRSAQKILDSTYELIQNNNPDRLEVKIKINKHLLSERKKTGDYPFLAAGENMEEEAEIVKDKIALLASSENYNYGDFAVLARANNHLDSFVACFKRVGIPYSLLGNRGLFDQEEVRVLISFLRFLVQNNDNVSLYQLITSSLFSFSPSEITAVLTLSRQQRVPLWEGINTLTGTNSEAKKIVETVENVKKKLHTRTVTQILYEFITETSLIKELALVESVENYLKIKNINLFFEKVKNFETQNENPTVFEFVDYLDLLIEAGENPAQAEIEDIDTVKLLTVHSAKGLEFPVVFLVNLVEDRFPSRQRKEALPLPDGLIKETLPQGDYHLEEERRLFYVGMTRSRDLLYLTFAKNYGGVREKRPSIFIKELKNKIQDSEEKKSPYSQLSLLEMGKKVSSSESTNNVTEKGIFLTRPIVLKFVSYSQLETFKTCPLKYYYKYILGVIGIPNFTLNFGQTLHRTLRDFHKADLSAKKKTLDELMHLYENHFFELAQGYTSREHRKESFRHGQEILEKYFLKHETLFGKPVFLEQRFNIKIGDISLIGAIDRIDQYDDTTYEVIDYKTGESSEKREKVDSDEQLTIYALASKEALGISPKNYTLYFLERDVKASTQRNNDQIEKQKDEVKKIIEEIKKGNFPAKAGKWCNWCEFNKICPAYKVGRNNF